MSAFLRRVFGWWTTGAGVVAASPVLAIALHLNHSRPLTSRSRASLIIAILIAAKKCSRKWLSRAPDSAVKSACWRSDARVHGLGWIGAGDWVDERAFDFRVSQQKADLARTLQDTSIRITEFCNARDQMAPPRPRPATWQQDVDAFERFETDTVRAYERRCGARVRAAHDLASLRGLRDRDLDAFFRHPANEFQMRVIAKKLDNFSATLAKR